MNEVRVLVLDVIDKTGLHVATLDNDNLDTFYNELKCSCFDVAVRKIGGKYYDIFCDDEGLFRERPIPSLLDHNLEPMLVGNLIFANHDEAGNTTDLSDEDIDNIMQNSLTLYSKADIDVSWTAIESDS